MPADMKESIAKAVRKLLTEKNVKKLTVKDIVEECQITRQTFYYHFEDIPDLFRWLLERGTERMLQEAKAQGSAEQELRYFFLVALNTAPYVKRGMQTNYRSELEHLLIEYALHFFEQIIEAEHLYQNYTYSEVRLILRYHSWAIIGILREWTEEDTKNLDRIVHQIYLLISGKVVP